MQGIVWGAARWGIQESVRRRSARALIIGFSGNGIGTPERRILSKPLYSSPTGRFFLLVRAAGGKGGALVGLVAEAVWAWRELFRVDSIH